MRKTWIYQSFTYFFSFRIDGYEVYKKLIDHDRTEEIPVAFLFAKGDEKDKGTGLELRAIDYIAKPFSSPNVMASLEAHLNLEK